ncbi:MAG: DUF4392 domain-containing protein [Candidatus Rokubacteria bacterium]|nr:DUF4392 domain-containing protein [Candidatus Rokubacteria bacterium]
MGLPDPIDHLLALDAGSRGIGGFYRPGGARRAAQSLARGKRVLLTTGFAVGPGMAETDGPPGAAVLGRALRRLGKAVSYLTDESAAPLLAAALGVLGESAEMALFPRDGAAGGARVLGAHDRPSHLVAVERPGRTRDGDYRNARGESIAAWNQPIDALFLAPPRGVITVGIGDGGNEIGMGNVRRRLLRQGTLAKRITSMVRVDHLVVAGVSNWGAYGVAAHLSILAKRPLLHTAEEERRLVTACVEAGGVDGITRRRVPTVDGLPLEVHVAMVELLRTLVDQQIRGGVRS